jgi:hypothetical protein
MDSARLQPAFFGGLFIGVLSALPIVNAGNCCCCLWVIAGGVLATYLRQQNSPTQLPAAEGALVGLLAGFIGGVLAVVLSIPMRAVTAPIERSILDRLLAGNPDVPAELRDALERVSVGGGFAAVRMVINVVVNSVFGMLGGLLGVAIFKKDVPPPPGTVDVLPPA